MYIHIHTSTRIFLNCEEKKKKIHSFVVIQIKLSSSFVIALLYLTYSSVIVSFHLKSVEMLENHLTKNIIKISYKSHLKFRTSTPKSWPGCWCQFCFFFSLSISLITLCPYFMHLMCIIDVKMHTIQAISM